MASTYWAAMRKSVEALGPDVEAMLLRATQGRVLKAPSNGHSMSKKLSSALAEGAHRRMQPG
jgi:hypothetical protein